MSRNAVAGLVLLAVGLAAPVILGVALAGRLASRQPEPPDLNRSMALARAAVVGLNLRRYMDAHPDASLESVELDVLVDGAGAVCSASDLLDPWGFPFVLVKYEGGEFAIRSNGSDGVPGGRGAGADILFPGPPAAGDR
jgi:hypothetical protein